MEMREENFVSLRAARADLALPPKRRREPAPTEAILLAFPFSSWTPVSW